jgi:hypothetical protein
MKFAFNSQGLILSISRAQKGEAYTCIECKKILIPKLKAKTPHFAHAKEGACRRGASVSRAHLSTQRFIQQKFPRGTCFLEHPFPKIGRIADVYIPSKKWVFEIQCSPMKSVELERRTEDYAQLGIRVIWILHTQRYTPERPNSLQKSLQHLPHYFSSIEKEGVGNIFDYHPSTFLRLPVNLALCKIRRVAPFFPKHPLEELRRKKWGLSFQGDLLDCLDKGLVPALPIPSRRFQTSWIRRLLHHLLRERYR